MLVYFFLIISTSLDSVSFPCICSFGQVGVGTTSDVLSPIELKALRSQGVKFVACGDEHTALLTQVCLWVEGILAYGRKVMQRFVQFLNLWGR